MSDKKYLPGKISLQIIPGRLYRHHGTIVRAKQRLNNGLRLVQAHKILNGFVRDSELEIISKQEVEEYLKEA